MKIRSASQEDAVQIAHVHVDSWRTTYKDILSTEFLDNLSYEQWTKMWENNLSEQHVYVAENEQGEIVGFSVGGKERTGKHKNYTGELYAIYILDAYQGKGIGKLLIQPVIEELQEAGMDSMLVWVLEQNDSKYFYEALGGKKVDSTDILIDRKKLNEVAYGWQSLDDINIGR